MESVLLSEKNFEKEKIIFLVTSLNNKDQVLTISQGDTVGIVCFTREIVARQWLKKFYNTSKISEKYGQILKSSIENLSSSTSERRFDCLFLFNNPNNLKKFNIIWTTEK